ncbi:MAG: short-chain fatty acyl-CoA regulator family protein [Alphaproteobacteria bacterium]
MLNDARLGIRIRRLRTGKRDTQARMAGRLGISASYLNLIENDRRPLTPALLGRLVEVYGVDEQVFLTDTPARLRADLAQVIADPLYPGPRLGERGLTELAATLPAAGRALLSLFRAYLAARSEAHGLGERLASDPFLAESRHRLLTRLTSIRSYSEILRDNVDLAVDRRQRFVDVLVDESEQLTGLVGEVFDFLAAEGTMGLAAQDSPLTLVEGLVRTHNNHYPELENAADALRESLVALPLGLHAALVEALQREHGVAVEAEGDTTVQPLPHESRTFQVARRLALLSCGPAIDRCLADVGTLPPPARELYQQVLGSYLAAAVIMPYGPFRQAVTDLRHDLEALQHRFGASFEQICHRLTTLQRPGAEGVPFHLLRVDIAGNVNKSFSASGLHIPRHGGLCPRWNAHLAFLTPGRIDTQIAQLPDGARYLFVAKAISRATGEQGAPCSHYSVAIGCDISFAPHLVYADGLVTDSQAHDVLVGLSCRQCPRRDCAQRAAPPPNRRPGTRT